jgi:hypothetical protein
MIYWEKINIFINFSCHYEVLKLKIKQSSSFLIQIVKKNAFQR